MAGLPAQLPGLGSLGWAHASPSSAVLYCEGDLGGCLNVLFVSLQKKGGSGKGGDKGGKGGDKAAGKKGNLKVS